MKRIVGVATFAVLGMVALSSCKKDYECVDYDGDVMLECINCNKSSKLSFTTSCSILGGTVVEK